MQRAETDVLGTLVSRSAVSQLFSVQYICFLTPSMWIEQVPAGRKMTQVPVGPNMTQVLAGVDLQFRIDAVGTSAYVLNLFGLFVHPEVQGALT